MNTDSDTRDISIRAAPRCKSGTESETESHLDRVEFALSSVVVEYENRPDRRTVYPEGLASVERMSTWLTADDDAFVALELVR